MITTVSTTPLTDGAVCFTIRTRGPVKSCDIDYGDGHTETLKLADNVSSPEMISQHKYAKGAWRALVLIRDAKGVKIDRRLVSWLQQ